MTIGEGWFFAGTILDAASGVLFIALGLFVAVVRPRRLNLAFGGFAVAFGAAYATRNVTGGRIDLLPPEANWVFRVGSLVAMLLLVPIALWFPRPLRRDERRLLAVPLAAMAVLLVGAVTRAVDRGGAQGSWVGGFDSMGVTLQMAGFLFLLTTLAVRYAAAHDDGGGRAGMIHASAALVAFPAMRAGMDVVSNAGRPLGQLEAAPDWIAATVTLLLGALWLRNARSTAAHERRASRSMALATLGAALVGCVAAALVLPQATEDIGLLGLARIVGVGLLAYAILQHQLMGIDLKVRWTVKQSTIGAVFVVVFFIVSESAQAVFSGRAGTFAGIAAAGALLFVLAPLQRFAERVSERAVPGVRPPAGALDDGRLAVYREQARAAWADGRLGAKERDMLDRLRVRLGISAEEALAIEREAAQR